MLLNRGRGRQARCVCGGGGGAQGAVGAAAAEPNRSPPLPLSRAPTQRGQPAGRWGGGVRCRGAGGRGAVGGFRNPRHCPHTQGERVVVVTLGVFVCARVWVGGCAGGGVRGGGVELPARMLCLLPWSHAPRVPPRLPPPSPPTYPPTARTHPPTHPPTHAPTHLTSPPTQRPEGVGASSGARASQGGEVEVSDLPYGKGPRVLVYAPLCAARPRVRACVCTLCVRCGGGCVWLGVGGRCGVEVGALGPPWGSHQVPCPSLSGAPHALPPPPPLQLTSPPCATPPAAPFPA